MTKFVAHGDADLSAGDLEALYRGTLGNHNASTFAVTASNDAQYTFRGENFGGYGSGSLPAAGQINRIVMQENGSAVSLSGFTLSAGRFATLAQHANIAGLEKALFSGNDTFALARTTHAVAAGENGRDYFLFGGALNTQDKIDGGAGQDVVRLKGDYTGLRLAAHTISNIESLQLFAQHDYKITFNDGNIASGALLHVDAHSVGAQHSVILNDAHESNGGLFVWGGHGNDHISTGSGDDTVFAGGGEDVIHAASGEDVISGGAGDDAIYFAGNLDAADRVSGATGRGDTLYLNGDYSHGMTFLSTTMRNVENVRLSGHHSYNFTFDDGNISAGKMLNINARALGAGDSAKIDDSHETNGRLTITGGHGADTVSVGAGGSIANLGGGNDVFHAGAGSDLANGGAGNDNFYYGFNFDVSDDVNGGAGSDTLHLSTPVAGVLSLTLGSSNMQSVEHVDLGDGNYNLTIGAGGLDVAKLNINALKVDAAHTVTIDGSAALATALTLVGGAGDNILTGGLGNDTLIAGLGSNILNGGGGHDTFVFDSLDSADQIVNFDGALDTLDVGHAVTGIDTSLLGGLLNDLGGLGTLVGSLLGAHHAMEISPILGALAGDNFLVIDQNGQSGFQAGQDLVVQLENATHLGSLGLGSFGI